MPRRKNTDIMIGAKEDKGNSEPQLSKLDQAILLAKELKKKEIKQVVIQEEDTDEDDDVEYIINTRPPKEPLPVQSKGLAPAQQNEVEVPVQKTKVKAEKKPRVKKESQSKGLVSYQPNVREVEGSFYNYEKIKYLEQENERLKNSLKFNALSRIQNFSNGMKIKF